MSADIVARGLALQARTATVTANDLAAVRIAPTLNRIDTSGYTAIGAGSGTYVSDALADAALAAAHPIFCKQSLDGRYWRLLPDDAGLIPVACGGAVGFSGNPDPVLTTGHASFEASPWSNNLTCTSAGVPGPGAMGGDATIVTADVSNFALANQSFTGNCRITARVKAGTAEYFYLHAGPFCFFNLATGTIAVDGIGTGAIVSLGGGWYEVSATATVAGNVGFGLSSAISSFADIGDTATLFDFTITDTDVETALATTDDRAVIRAAEAYRHAVGAAGLRFDARRYAARRVTLPGGTDYALATNYVLFDVRSSSIWKSAHPEGTTIYRRKANGQQCNAADFEVTTGYGANFRGAGIYIHGSLGSDPGASAHSFTLDNIMLDGGLRASMGLTFEILDKAIWQQNDHHCGHLTFKGKAGAIGFCSELVYTSAASPASAAKRYLTIGPDCVFGETGGSCLNPQGITLRVERCLCYNAYIGIEGWTGAAGGYLNAVFQDISFGSSIQGGVYSTPPANYYAPNAPVAGTLPVGKIDILLIRAQGFAIGSWIEGKITAIDCTVNIGSGSTFVSGSDMLDLDITTIADQGNVLAGLVLLGGASGAQTTRNCSIRLNCKRTAFAAAGGYKVSNAIYTYGSIGTNVRVELGALEGSVGPYSRAAALYDNAPLVLGFEYDGNTATANGYYDIQTNHNATIDLINAGPVIATSCTVGGSYNLNLPVTGIQAGHRLIIGDYTKNFVAGGAALRIPAGNFRAGKGIMLPPGYGHTELAFDGGLWTVIKPPPALAATAAWNPTSIASGAQTSTTVAAIGAVVGDAVEAGFSNDLQGLVLTAYVSAANTVTAVLANLTGGAVDLGSGTLTVAVKG